MVTGTYSNQNPLVDTHDSVGIIPGRFCPGVYGGRCELSRCFIRSMDHTRYVVLAEALIQFRATEAFASPYNLSSRYSHPKVHVPVGYVT